MYLTQLYYVNKEIHLDCVTTRIDWNLVQWTADAGFMRRLHHRIKFDWLSDEKRSASMLKFKPNGNWD
jgi:hypothetical protein